MGHLGRSREVLGLVDESAASPVLVDFAEKEDVGRVSQDGLCSTLKVDQTSKIGAMVDVVCHDAQGHLGSFGFAQPDSHDQAQDDEWLPSP